MADGLRKRGNRKGSESDGDVGLQETDLDAVYSSGSDVPPPPTYDEAIDLGLEQTSGATNNNENHQDTSNESEVDRRRHRDTMRMRQESKDNDSSPVDLEQIEMMTVDRDSPAAESGGGAGVAMDTLGVDIDGRYSPRNSSIGGSTVSVRDEQDAEANRSQDCKGFFQQSSTKMMIIAFSVLFVTGLVLLVSLLPASFVYIDYYQMGFIHNSVSGHTDTSQVYQHGSHLLAPQHSTVLFPTTAHFASLNLQVFNSEGLSISLSSSFQYFLRAEELSILFRKYDKNYDQVVKNKAESTIKNALTRLTLEEIRLNRTLVEHRLLDALTARLSGDCCSNRKGDTKRSKLQQPPADSSRPRPPNYANQRPCDPSDQCYRGLHVEVAYFQLGAVEIPDQVLSNYLKQITLQIEAEREQFIQERAVVKKETSLIVQNIENQAKEIREGAKAKAVKLSKLAQAAKLLKTETAYSQALNGTFHRLGLSNEEDRLAFMYLHTLGNVKDNLAASSSYNYDKISASSP